MNLFYLKNLPKSAKQIIFDKEESRHIFKVLRYKVGDTIFITDGLGTLLTAELISVSQKECTASIINTEEKNHLPYYLHLAVAPTKNNDRFEWFLEKATEIGISEITPIICDHSERKIVKIERFEKIIESAMKQSLKMHKPLLNSPLSFTDFINENTSFSGEKLIAHCHSSEKKELKNSINNHQILIMIGPEGDFSLNELDLAQKNQFTEISLGESRLRTETAAIVACHTISLLHNT